LTTIALVLAFLPVFLVVYSYLVYPLILFLLRKRSISAARTSDADLPTISITVPVYNEEAQIAGLIETLLDIDYPVDRRQILIVSDASSDGTDDIIKSYADRGIEFLRVPTRGGKTAAENAASALLRGSIVINSDATIRIRRDAVLPLVAVFADPTVGAASGRDMSIGKSNADENVGEAGYVGYEMGVRALETGVDGIVGASGCFYAIRSELHRCPLPDALSRDFAAALITRQHGLRTVSVDQAICYVPRTASLRREYKRKVRTIMRGIETLYYMRAMLNIRRYGRFSWMLFSHKICRWLVPWTVPTALLGLAIVSSTQVWARVVLLGATLSLLATVLAWVLDGRRALPRWIVIPAYAWSGNIAAMHALIKAARGDQNPAWEPTRRESIGTPPTVQQ